MLNNPHFYNRTIRKVVVAFGTTFNEIFVVRFANNGTPKERFKVPLSYGAKEKYLTRLTSDPTLTKSIATVVPRISFNLDGLSYDNSRKQVTTLQNFARNTSSNNSTSIRTQYAPIPYNFDFSMSIFVRNTEDGTQILEQILPFFTPDFTVTVDFIEPMDQKYDMPIILNSVASSTDYEGDLMTTRLIMWDLQFTAKAYIWPAVKTQGLINTSFTNVYADGTTPEKLFTITTNSDPIDAGPDDEYGFSETKIEYYAKFEPPSFLNFTTTDTDSITSDATTITTDRE